MTETVETPRRSPIGTALRALILPAVWLERAEGGDGWRCCSPMA